MDDQSLRDAFAAAISRRVPTSRDACPSPEALQELATATGDSPARLALLQHVATCSACRADFDLLRTAEQAAPAAAPRRSVRWVPSLAAAVLCAVAGTMVLQRPPATDVTRGSGGDGAIRMIQIVTTPDSVSMTWHAVRDAVRYRLDVIAPDGSIALSVETADTVARGALRGGTITNWALTAVLLDGTERSATFNETDAPTGSPQPR